MKRLIIVGAGSLGRELYSWIRGAKEYQAEWSFYGFIDDNLKSLEGYPYKAEVIGSIQSYLPTKDDVFVLAIMQPKLKLHLAAQLEQRGANFVSIVHETALIADNVTIGKGSVICPRVVVSCDTRIGDFVTVNLSSTVGHDVKIGNGCTINCHVDITGFVQLGEGVLLGSHASILQRVVVQDFAVVGAGSVVLRTVEAGSTVMGVPAKKLLGFNK